ncbi:MAG: LacI family DNA-binding transcriptional regulator [Anaerolineae bacterium]
MPTITLKEVASTAGVSQATVSRVLNNHPTVNAELRERVQEAIRKLGYHPNQTARRLRAKTSNVIGLIISDIQNPYFISIIRGIEDTAYAQQMSIILCNSDEDAGKQEMYLRVMQSEHVAGLIYVPTPDPTGMVIHTLLETGIPIILLDRVLDEIELDIVKVDNVQGAYDAVAHLLELGYRRIGTIMSVPELTTGKERYEGYCKALKAFGVGVDTSLVKIADSRSEGGYRMANELLSLPQRPDAIFVGNNLMTLGTLRALHEANVDIPGEIALVGFDDMPWSGDLRPPLTVISQPTYELGREAVQLLQRRITQPDAPHRTVTLQTQLIIRESCGSKVRRKKDNEKR